MWVLLSLLTLECSLRVLGVHFDPKLNWGAHIKKVQQNAVTQVQSVSRLTQSTWGATFHKAKQLYSTIVRPALTYGSSIWAETGTTGNIPERIVNPLKSIQRRCLLSITGAYKSTSARVLQHETSILPMEIYLKNRRVQHAGLTRDSAVQGTIEKTCQMIRQQTRGKSRQESLSKERDREEWARICCGEESIKGQKEMGKIAAFQEWKNSWPQLHRNRTLRLLTSFRIMISLIARARSSQSCQNWILKNHFWPWVPQLPTTIFWDYC